MKGKCFVDLQVNGYLGVDFSSDTLELDDISRVTDALLRAGTRGYCATLITSPLALYRRNLPLLARAQELTGIRGRMLGIHLEGPYISPVEGARGAHQEIWTRSPDVAEFDRMQDWAGGRIALLTMAPELEGALQLVEHVRKNHPTTVCLGHHLAGRSIIRDAVRAGATGCTHLGNGCPNWIHRHDNVILHQLAEPGLTAGLITDGHHIPEDLIRVAVCCKGADRLFVVSDSAPIAGLPPGVYETMGNRVRMSPTGRIENIEASHFVGSGLNMAGCMHYLESTGLLTPEELRKVGLENPLSLIAGALPDDYDRPDIDLPGDSSV